jgi:tight adherence protein B
MRFLDPLLQSAGLHQRKRELVVIASFLVSLSFLVTYLATSVIGMAISVAVLTLGALLEMLRLKANARQKAFDALWPQVFDSFQNAAAANLSTLEQFEYLANKGPLRLREQFRSLYLQLDAGVELAHALESFKRRIGSRHADFLALLIEISAELGGRGLTEWWKRAASDIRQEQALLGEVMAKQGWVLGSAKVALVAPWLIAFVLLRLEQNREAYASELGALVLFFGLLLSLVAYALVNKLGSLRVPDRVFYEAS